MTRQQTPERTDRASRQRAFQLEGQVNASAPRPGCVWHVERPQASGWQQCRRPPVLRSLPGTWSSLSGSPQTATTWHSLREHVAKKAGSRRCQTLIALTATVPSSSWLQAACQHQALFLLISLAEPQEQYKRSQQMNSPRPGRASPPCWVNWALAEWPVGPTLLFGIFLKE